MCRSSIGQVSIVRSSVGRVLKLTECRPICRPTVDRVMVDTIDRVSPDSISADSRPRVVKVNMIQNIDS